MKILNHKQGSHKWLKSRLGKPSASNFDKLITTTGNPSASAEQYINRLIAEKLTGESAPHFMSDAMTRGIELEPEAKMYFEMSKPVTCGETGFILDDSGDFGCSPDLVIYDNGEDTIIGGCEIKVPLDHTHVANMRRKLMPKKYYQQVQGCMMICEVESWWFMSYHPIMEAMVVEVKRDDEFIKKLSGAVNLAVEIIKSEVKRLS